MSTDNKTTITLELTEPEATAVFLACLTAFFADNSTEATRRPLNDILCAMEDIGFGEVE